LHELVEVDVRRVLELLEKHTTPSGNISGVVSPVLQVNRQEKRDFYFGRLFGLNVLLESDILLRPGSQAAISAIIDHLITLAGKKPWLREPSAKCLCQLINLIPQLHNGNSVADEIVRKVEDSGLMPSQDGAAILLALTELPEGSISVISNKTWKHGDPLHYENDTQLEKALKEISDEGDTIKSSGNFKGDPHFIWHLILQRCIRSSRSGKTSDTFEDLWRTVVDGTHLQFTNFLNGFSHHLPR
jgi:DNA polymerase phi